MQVATYVKFLMLSFFALATISAQAQTTEPDTKITGKEKRGRSQEQRAARLEKQAEVLGLTEEQKAAFIAIEEQYGPEIKATREEAQARTRSLMAEQREAKRALLTEEQAVKFDEMQAKRREQRGKRGGKRQ